MGRIGAIWTALLEPALAQEKTVNRLVRPADAGVNSWKNEDLDRAVARASRRPGNPDLHEQIFREAQRILGGGVCVWFWGDVYIDEGGDEGLSDG